MTPPNMRPCSRRWSTFRCREDRREFAAGGVAAPATGGDDGLGSGGRAVAAGRHRLRGLALGRPDLARSHGALAERGAQAPLLVVATTRPEFRATWAMRSHHGVISLAPLDRAQVARMVGEIATRHALSEETIDGVGERTGGVPLFVEEVTRLLLERDAQGGAQAIPPTLQQSLAARLDRLGEAREIAQIGAVLGREFSTSCSATWPCSAVADAARRAMPASPRPATKASTRRDSSRLWIGSRKPTSCLSTAPLRPPPTASSTH